MCLFVFAWYEVVCLSKNRYDSALPHTEDADKHFSVSTSDLVFSERSLEASALSPLH